MDAEWSWMLLDHDGVARRLALLVERFGTHPKIIYAVCIIDNHVLPYSIFKLLFT